MKSNSESLVFFGSGPVAAKSLELLAKNFAIEIIITKPRPAHHKGSVPVLDMAEKLSIPTLTVNTKTELDTVVSEKRFTSRLAVLIDFGIIVSQKVIETFELGILNSHFSILPDLRGADPITFAVLSGQKQTGVSLMFIVEAMDEGPLVGYGEYNMPKDITTPKLTHDLIYLSDALLQKEIPRIFAEELKGAPQTMTGRKVSYSNKLAKKDSQLDWSKPAKQLEREVRAYLGWPGSRTKLGKIEVIITKSHVENQKLKPGEYKLSKDSLLIGTSKDSLSIDRLKPAGKNEMDIRSFLSGYRDKLY